MSPTKPSLSPILILNGNATIPRRIARQLSTLSIPAIVASPPSNLSSLNNSNPNSQNIPFSWTDASTWANPFDAVPDGSIKAVYLAGSPNKNGNTSLGIAGVMMEFIDFARSKGVKRFVLESQSWVEAGGPEMGKVHAYLRERGSRGEVEWGVLRVGWLQECLAEMECHVKSIREESKIYSASGDGKIPWISADDVANVAVQTLTRKDAPNTEFLVLGPELLTYDDLAGILSELLGRKIVHVDLSKAAYSKHQQMHGMPESEADLLSSMDTAVKFGAENRTNDVVLSVTGIAPKLFREYAKSVKSVWEPLTVA